MNGSTKILTVSYGTFSCTLEGFDDPLGSMREMAEYFRDLAADDRYFGAEPPTPDVEMLQRIAEKEVQRRVEARVTDTGVALVAAPAPAEPIADPVAEAPSRPVKKPVSDEESHGPLTYDDDFLMSDEPEDVLTVDPNAKPNGSGPAETVAEKLRRIRAVVSQSIELENSQVRGELSPNANDPDLRDRALTKTIQQIQADLSDEEGTTQDVPVVAETPTVSDHAERPEAAIEAVAEDKNEADIDTDTDTDTDIESDAPFTSDGWDFEPELLDEEAEDATDPDRDTVSGVLNRIAEETREVADALPAKPVETRVTTLTLSPEPEADVGRLLDEADSKLNEDETVRRRRVISQMRAAVAATKADRLVSRQVSREDAAEAEIDPYREDLSEAVQVTPASETTRRPSPPPLVLVSSQRVDPTLSEDPPASSTRAEDLATFAERFGAKELTELMEAAAAFAVFSEGQSSFTRPEIMKRVARIDPTLQLSREDSLRSFGQLLRQGTFKKLERGQFTIDAATRFHPEQRVVS